MRIKVAFFTSTLALSALLALSGCGKKPNDGKVTPPEKQPEKVVVSPGGGKADLTVDLGNGVKMEFMLIKPGSFVMGDDKATDDLQRPQHKVTITKPFYLGKYEVTQEQWEAVMGSNPSKAKGPKLPVETVSWIDCQSFMAKLNQKIAGHGFQLPTEAQWEYACRAGSTGKYCFGDDDAKLKEYACFQGSFPFGATFHIQPVGEKKPNAWGLYDMHGNVAEWCNDHDGRYSAEAVTDPQGDDRTMRAGSRMMRGGSFASPSISLHSANRFGDYSTRTGEMIGLRCAAMM